MFTSTDSATRKKGASNSYLPTAEAAHTCIATPCYVSSSRLLCRAQGETRTQNNCITTIAVDSLVSLGSRCTLWNMGSISSGLPDLIPALAPSFQKYFWVQQTVIVITARTEELKLISWLNTEYSFDFNRYYGQWEKAFFVPALPILQSVGTHLQHRLYTVHTEACVLYTCSNSWSFLSDLKVLVLENHSAGNGALVPAAVLFCWIDGSDSVLVGRLVSSYEDSQTWLYPDLLCSISQSGCCRQPFSSSQYGSQSFHVLTSPRPKL